MHAGLEVVYRHQQLGIFLEAGDVAKKLMDSWAALVDEEEMTFDSPAEEQALQKQALDLVCAYLAYVPANEPKPLAVEAGIEAPLIDPTTGEDFGIPLVGIVDLILDGDGDGGVGNRALICDFKTTARSSQPIEIVHEIQLTSYSYLFRHVQQRQETGLEIRSLVKTKTPKIEFHRYPARTEAHFARLFAIVREYLDALDSERFNFRPGFGCAMCDFQKQCRRWSG